jgi:hypothetical protein
MFDSSRQGAKLATNLKLGNQKADIDFNFQLSAFNFDFLCSLCALGAFA